MNGRLRWGQALVVLVTVLAIGCSGGIGSRGSDAAPTVEELKRRVLDLQRRATINEVELTRLRQRVTELEAGSRASAKASSVRETPRTAEVERALMAPRKPPKIDETDLEPVKYAQSGALSEAEVILSPEGSLAPVRASEQAQSLYDRGYSLYHQGRFLDAEGEAVQEDMDELAEIVSFLKEPLRYQLLGGEGGVVEHQVDLAHRFLGSLGGALIKGALGLPVKDGNA